LFGLQGDGNPFEALHALRWQGTPADGSVLAGLHARFVRGDATEQERRKTRQQSKAKGTGEGKVEGEGEGEGDPRKQAPPPSFWSAVEGFWGGE
jgi:hypothetical protein